LGFGLGDIRTLHLKLVLLGKMRRAWTDPLGQSKQWKRVMKFRTWNVRSMNNSGSLRTVAWELTVYKLDVVGVQGVKWDTGGTQRPGIYYCFY